MFGKIQQRVPGGQFVLTGQTNCRNSTIFPLR